MRIQFVVKTQLAGPADLLIDNDTEDNCHYNGPDDGHAAIRRTLAEALAKSDFPLEAGDTIQLINLDD